MNKLRLALELLRRFGPGWLVYRLGYALRIRTGLLRRQTPVSTWEALPLSHFLTDPKLSEPSKLFDWLKTRGTRFLFAPGDRAQFQTFFADWDDVGGDPIAEADDLLRGTFRYFAHRTAETGFPPDWHRDPFSGERIPHDRHWSRVDDFQYGDIKIFWELNRFGFAYTLVRAYWRTGDERYPEAFWRLVEDWRIHNPPNCGANWKCGQETSFRVMAWCFGLYGFMASPATTPERVLALAQMIAVSGQRIEANLSHALSQRNNHGVSEGMGLWTIGLLFPELKAAAGWREKGRRVLEQLVRELIYEDGAFAQHSMNYHRLMLHDYIWSIRLGVLNQQRLSPDLCQRVIVAGEFLFQLQDEASGQVPHYGNSDGALILPLSNSGYWDYRPVVQAANYLGHGNRQLGNGAWDEALLWLFGAEAIRSPETPGVRTDFQASAGGYNTLRADNGFTFVRCASFRHRPSQADMLHVDLWWRGLNIAIDPGTNSYNAPSPWNDPFAQTAYHNTVTVDGLDQMRRVSRFLWLPWLHAQTLQMQPSEAGHIAYWEGEHDGYMSLKSPVRVRRGILRLGEEHWLVCDRLISPSAHNYRLHWLFPDYPFAWDPAMRRLTLDTPNRAYVVSTGAFPENVAPSLVRAEPSLPRGWQSPYYSQYEPAISLEATIRIDRLIFWTVFGPGVQVVAESPDLLAVTTAKWLAAVGVSGEDEQPIITKVLMTGELNDRWGVF